ncbi:MAG TPA: Ig-like domain-containing protein [Anaerolineaceae bacterium]|nr:Ig-like domain-containing protein [Anaerolineaceae bacterium]
MRPTLWKVRPFKAISVILMMGLLMGCTLPSIPGLPGQATATPAGGPVGSTPIPTQGATDIPRAVQQEPLPPALVETQPLPSSDLGSQEPVVLSFNQAMDLPSVESAIKIEPAIGGSFQWENSATVRFTPDQKLAPGTQVRLTVESTAKAANGLALLAPVSLEYQAADALRLAEQVPKPGTQDVDPSAAVVAAFNRPVVPLGADPSQQPAAFTLDPAVQGRGEWLNTSTYIFYPDPALGGGVSYAVHLNPGLTASDGMPLDANRTPASWTFSTAKPKLVKVEPSTESPIPIEKPIQLTFNQPMDRASAQGAFSLTDASGNPIAGSFTWEEKDTILVFQPSAPLTRGTNLTLKLSGQAKGAGDAGVPLGTDFSAALVSLLNLAVSATQPEAGKPLPVPGGFGTVVLSFTAPVPAKGIETFFAVTPPVSNLSVYADGSGTQVYVSGFFKANSDYTLSVSPDLADVYGQKLGAPFTLAIHTEPAPPALTLAANQIGTDTFFLTPQDKTVIAQATNLAELNLSLAGLSWNEYLRLTGPQGFDARKNYHPANPKTWTQTLSLVPDQNQVINVNVSPDGNGLAPGLYAYSVQSPQLQGQSNASQGPLVVVSSRVQVTFKYSATEALIWAVSLDQGLAPVSGENVSIYDQSGGVLGSGTTDAQGLSRFNLTPMSDPYGQLYAVLGKPGDVNFGIAASSWNLGVNGYDFGLPTDFSGPHTQVYLYTDRPIYRPGQPVSFRGVIRRADNGRYTLPDLLHVLVNIYGTPNPDGNSGLLSAQDLPLSSYGTVSGSFTLAADAPPGLYRISAQDLPGAQGADLFFEVADYRKPEINLEASLAPKELKAGDALEGSVQASYYFGAPAADQTVHWALYRSNEPFNLADYVVGTTSQDGGMFGQGMVPARGFLGPLVQEGDAHTGKDGKAAISLQPLAVDQTANGSPMRYTLEVTLQDQNNQPVSVRAQALVHPAQFYAGVRPDAWTGSSGTQMGFDILTVDWLQRPIEVQNLHADFSKVTWKESDASAGGPFPQPQFTPVTTPVSSSDFSTSSRGQARLAFTPPDPGTYQVEISGGGAKTQAIVWVGGVGTAVWPNLPNQRLQLTANTSDYQPGETAHIFIPNPFGQGALALVTQERGKIISSAVVPLDPNGSTYDVALSDESAPNIYVSATVLGRLADGQPDFRQGFLNVHVQPKAQTLKVELAAQPAQSQPGGEATLALRASDANGKPVKGEFSLALTDLAALGLADSNAPGIVAAFYQPQPLGVRTSLSLAVYGKRSVLVAGGQGGGGDNGFPGTFPVVRENFPDTAYWSGQIETDENGLAQVRVTLPDSLTTWQLDARGVTADTRVGEATTRIVASKDLIVRPITPRFLVAGDHVRLGALLQNNTQVEVTAEVTLQSAGGFAFDEPDQAAQKVQVAANGQAKVEWWGTAQSGDELDLIFGAKAGDLQDTARPAGGPIRILHYSSPVALTTAGVLASAGEKLEVVSLPGSFQPTGGSLQLELTPSLASAIVQSLETLGGNPEETDSNETDLSRFLAQLEGYNVLKDQGVDLDDLKDRLDHSVTQGTSRLVNQQHPDGGWGWSSGSQSDPILSAYILFGLSRASVAGAQVPAATLQKAQEYLRGNLAAPGKTVRQAWQLDRLVFIQFALQQSGAGDKAGTAALLGRRGELSRWAQALLAFTLNQQIPGDGRVNTIVSDLEASAIRSASGVHWEDAASEWQNLSTPVQGTALVVFVLAQLDPASTLLPDAVRYLMANRTASLGWGSTYEAAWVLMALSEYLKGTGDVQANFAFSASLNGTQIASGTAGGRTAAANVHVDMPLSNLLKDAPNALRIQREDGAGRLYYQVNLQMDRPVESAAPLKQGLTIERSYFAWGQSCGQQGCTPVQDAQLSGGPPPLEGGRSAPGQVTVRLTVTAPKDMYHLRVEDWVPAGMEIFNPQLKTAARGNPQPGLDENPAAGSSSTGQFDPRDPFAAGWGWWLFGSPRIFGDHIDWTADYLAAGTYQLTYNLIPGQAGEYHVLPARAWQEYFPDVQAATAGGMFTVK